ncbi:hypothetical protein Pelo_11680 [Pelomyxa schiedti]|nr:hypothetical protein Pelo_11680 [Pelomyxa schiedti]
MVSRSAPPGYVENVVYAQGGFVPFRTQSDGSVEVLLISSRKSPGEWVIPKGFLAKGETHQDAAMKKARAEAGVMGLPRIFLGEVDDLSTHSRLKVWSLEVTTMFDSWEQQHERERRWYPLSAIDTLNARPAVKQSLQNMLIHYSKPTAESSVTTEVVKHCCNICLSNEVDSIFLDCGHQSACMQCAAAMKTCPICRGAIREVKKVFKT